MASRIAIVSRRERWGLTGFGWLLLGIVAVGAFITLLFGSYPFLAVTKRVDARFLVVEGWIHQYGMKAAYDEFETGKYERVFSTGGPISGTGGYTNDYNTSANWGAGRLRALGIPTEVVEMVPARENRADRTYASAVALRRWSEEHNLPLKSMNVVTEDVHARRTRLLYQKAFGKGVQIGIIGVPSPDYDARRWWRYSEGVRGVLGEGIAYLYARFVFKAFSS